MSKSWDDMMERLGSVEATVKSKPWAEDRYPALAQRQDKLLRAQIDRLSGHTATIRLGDILAAEPVWTRTTFAFDSSYPTGGENIDIEGLVPTFVDAIIPPNQGYTFWYDVSGDKILAYFGGSEVADTTDLSTTPGTVSVFVLGTRDTSLPGYVSGGGEVVTKVTLTVGGAFAADGTDFWTLVVFARGLGESFGEELGRRTTKTAGLATRDPVTLYANARGATLEAGDVVLLSATAQTASTATLREVFLTLTLQRKVT